MDGHSSQDSELDERTERDLVLLADGRLEGARREELEQRIAGSPTLAAALERQRSVGTTLRSIDLPAPAGLRSRIEAERSTPSRPVRRRRIGWAAGLAGAAAAAAVAAALILPSGTGGPSVVEAAQLSDLPATQERVPIDPANPAVLAQGVDGVPFPNLRPEFGWRPAGSRTDELDGRETRTVFYERRGQRIGYTILTGDRIDPPDDAALSVVNDVELESLADDGKQIVTWVRGGLTCVLSGEGVDSAELQQLAAWKGDGAVPF